MKIAVCIPFATLAVHALAVTGDEASAFLQFRHGSSLPGSLFGITPEGTPSIQGALTVTTPIAYSLAPNRFVLAGSSSGSKEEFKLGIPSGDTDEIAWAAAGFTTLDEKFTVSLAMLEPGFPKTVSLHWELPKMEGDPYTLAFGVQDIFNSGRTGSQTRNTHSFYAVGTVEWQGVYFSAGYGTHRFGRGFASASFPVGDQFRFLVEHDGYGWLTGGALKLFDSGSLFLGVRQGGKRIVGFGVAF